MNPRDREAQAAATVRDCRAALAALGSSIIREAIGPGFGEPIGSRHYPDGEVYDPVSHVQYFYHSHPSGAAIPANEHGHFHLFLRGEGLPPGMTPLVLPETAVANAPSPGQSVPVRRGSSDRVCHIVAVAIDSNGEPIRLFTTNRWVTGETWYRARDVARLLDRWRLQEGGEPLLINRWIEAIVCLFCDEICALLDARDATLTHWRWRWPRSNALEDHRLEILSSCKIDLEARLASIEEARDLVSRRQGTANRAGLPSMTDGWGA
jgi:hypothetical protein